MTSQMINDAKIDFGNVALEIFRCEDGPTKIEVSPDGQRIYYGGNSLGMLERSRGQLVDTGLIFKGRMFGT